MLCAPRSLLMDELWKLSALELRAMIGLKEVKPSEVMEVILGRIEKVNPKINAFCTLAPDSAMAEARKADEQVAQGNCRSEGPPPELSGLYLSFQPQRPARCLGPLRLDRRGVTHRFADWRPPFR
jgi:hypothetical protein